MTTELHPLAHYRKAAGLSQWDLAQMLGFTGTGTISKWENGQVPAEQVLRVERVTNIPRHRLRPDLYPVEAKEKARA